MNDRPKGPVQGSIFVPNRHLCNSTRNLVSWQYLMEKVGAHRLEREKVALAWKITQVIEMSSYRM